MNVERKYGPKLEVDSIVNESVIRQLEMKPLNNHGMNYELYSKGFYIYFFKRIEENKLQLFCTTSKESYYFSNNNSLTSQDDRVGLMEWLFA